MRNTRAGWSVLFVILTAAGACVMRFFQAQQSAPQAVSAVFYICIICSLAASAFYAASHRVKVKALDIENSSNSVFISCFALSAAFFYDFLHQGYNCYSYVNENDYVDSAYLILMAASGVFAVISCFYYITVALTRKNPNYDFKNFTLLHFVPALWAIARLLMILFYIVNIDENIDISCEFIVLCTALFFIFSMILQIDRGEAPATGAFIFSCVALCAASVIIGVSRVVDLIYGTVSQQSTYSAVTYVMLGVFALALLRDTLRRNKIDI